MPKAKEPQLKQANLSYEQMKNAIPKIERRIKELEVFDVKSVTESSDPRINTLQNKLDDLLLNIFGVGTVEYDKYRWDIARLNRASVNLMYKTSTNEVLEGIQQGIEEAKSQLQAIKSGFIEELDDAGQTSAGKTLKAYEGLELHLAIERTVGQLFRDGHYANAIEDAVKALNQLVRLNSGVDNEDGTTLMEHVFSPKNPILKFNNLIDDTDRNEQKGFMMLFSGAVAGLRNPRAHKIIKDDPEMALEFIAFISLLAKLADKSKK